MPMAVFSTFLIEKYIILIPFSFEKFRKAAEWCEIQNFLDRKKRSRSVRFWTTFFWGRHDSIAKRGVWECHGMADFLAVLREFPHIYFSLWSEKFGTTGKNTKSLNISEWNTPVMAWHPLAQVFSDLVDILMHVRAYEKVIAMAYFLPFLREITIIRFSFCYK